MVKTAYLKDILVQEGMFPNERTISVKTYEGEMVSGFFQEDFIIEGKGLKVYRLEEIGDRVLIQPKYGEFLEENKRIIAVHKKSLA